jgi:MFS family permease
MDKVNMTVAIIPVSCRAVEAVERKVRNLDLSAEADALTGSNTLHALICHACLQMGLEMGWSPTTAGLVQSSFFYGFLLMQLPGGILSSRFGGAFVLPRGIALWSAATAAIPFVVGSMPALCVTRSVMGMGEATAPSSIVDMITRVVPPAKRASSVSFAYGGLHVGTLVSCSSCMQKSLRHE